MQVALDVDVAFFETWERGESDGPELSFLWKVFASGWQKMSFGYRTRGDVNAFSSHGVVVIVWVSWFRSTEVITSGFRTERLAARSSTIGA
ncbi:MAG: hypothetical protein RJA70_1466 [Pseudomonadota bacterium]